MSSSLLPTRAPARPRRLGRRERTAGRLAAAFLAAVVLSAGCSASTPETTPSAAREVVVTSTTANPVVETTATAPPAPAPVAPPLAAHEVLVGEVHPEIAELVTYDAPGGLPFRPELPQINPWYFGGPLTVLVVSGLETDPWLQVELASRPNRVTGWIRTTDVTLRRHRFHITVAVGDRMLRAYEGEALLLETPIVVGRANTPTPLGRFFVNALVPQARPGGAYGPMILSISSFSEVLDSFDGGLPEIGLHGTNQPSLLGTAASNGCIRMSNDAVLQLASLVPAGTVVDFVA